MSSAADDIREREAPRFADRRPSSACSATVRRLAELSESFPAECEPAPELPRLAELRQLLRGRLPDGGTAQGLRRTVRWGREGRGRAGRVGADWRVVRRARANYRVQKKCVVMYRRGEEAGGYDAVGTAFDFRICCSKSTAIYNIRYSW